MTEDSANRQPQAILGHKHDAAERYQTVHGMMRENRKTSDYDLHNTSEVILSL